MAQIIPEPIYRIMIRFPGNAIPMNYSNLDLKRVCEVLTKWSEDYILTLDKMWSFEHETVLQWFGYPRQEPDEDDSDDEDEEEW